MANRDNEYDAAGNIISRNLEGRFAPAPLRMTREVKIQKELDAKTAQPVKKALKSE